MKRIVFYILLFLLFYPLYGTDNGLKLYRLQNPQREMITRLQKDGAVVDRLIPAQFTDIYLRPEQFEQIKNAGYAVTRIKTASWSAADSLAWRNSQLHTDNTDYHTYAEVTAFLNGLENQYPQLCRVYSIGQTVQGREMWVLKISNQVDTEEAEPEVKYVSSMHGDEIVGQELMLRLAELLLSQYSTNSRIARIVNNTEIWIMPNMNFDGTNMNYNGSFSPRRWNANGVDLNRNFPDREYGDPPFAGHPYALQPETINIMQFSDQHNFVMSANFHGGALVANYPWDKYLPGDIGTYPYAGSVEDQAFIENALTYAMPNLPMFNSSVFQNGITNGAAWYETDGCMQDWNYNEKKCMSMTLEISQIKWPAFSTMDQYWDDNRESLLAYIEKALSGIRGIVTDSITGSPLAAGITILETGLQFENDADLGDYYRVTSAGTYSLLFESPGYFSKTFYNVPSDSPNATVLKVQLLPLNSKLISGQVLDIENSLPIRNAVLNFRDLQGIKTFSAATSISGNFQVAVMPDSYAVEISRDGYFSITDTVFLNSDSTLVYQMQKVYPAKIKGTVTSSAGGSIEGTLVWCQGSTDTLFSSNSYEIAGLYPGRVSAFAYLFGHRTARVDTVIANGDSLNYNFMLSPGSDEKFEDFENPETIAFDLNGDWQIGNPAAGPAGAFSGQNCLATGLNANYSSALLKNSAISADLNILGLVHPVLQFYHWYDFEQDIDGGNLQVSTDGGQTWQIVFPDNGYPVSELAAGSGNALSGQPAFSGQTASWMQEEFDLAEFKNSAALRIRFQAGSNDTITAAGWFIDDISLSDKYATSINTKKEIIADQPFIASFYPNPFNPVVNINLRLLKAQQLSISIFDSRGMKIKTIRNEFTLAGTHNFKWAGVNEHGNLVGSGVYFIRINSHHYTKIFKSVLLK